MKDLACTIPMPIQVVIDDVGWWSGKDGSLEQDPYRTGFVRDHVPADYRAIVELGRTLNIRPIACMILGEWDTGNWLRAIPSASREGTAWDNRRWVGPWLEEAAHILRTHRDVVEIGLHGIYHEYWEDGRFTRSEWMDQSGASRPEADSRARLDLFGRLLDAHGLGSFPRAFVPSAFVWAYQPEETALPRMLREAGVRYISTPFGRMLGNERIGRRPLATDQGLLLVDRGKDPCRWNHNDCHPKDDLRGAICGMHWPNLLHPDPERNGEVVQRWAAYLQSLARARDRILAPDMAAATSQLIYRELTSVTDSREGLTLDFADVLSPEYDAFRQPCFELRLRATPTARFEGEGIVVEQQIWSDEGYHRLTVRPLAPRACLHPQPGGRRDLA